MMPPTFGSLNHAGKTASSKLMGLEPRCPIPDVCTNERRLPRFIARATLRDLIAGLEARATSWAAR
jgi:hypothetical protein